MPIPQTYMHSNNSLLYQISYILCLAEVFRALQKKRLMLTGNIQNILLYHALCINLMLAQVVQQYEILSTQFFLFSLTFYKLDYIQLSVVSTIK